MTAHRLSRIVSTSLSLFILVVPASSNYSLSELDFGSGGGVGQSDQFKMESLTSEQGSFQTGDAYNGGIGFGFTQMAAVPAAPTLTNPDNFYNQLHLVIDPSGNPSDTLFAIAISTDNFATTNYVKSDQALGNSLSVNDYQTYSSWGGGSGFNILGLEPSTNYQVKVKAMQGQFTESPYGPTTSASTAGMSLTFDIDIAATDSLTDPPHNLSLGTLLANTLVTASSKIWLSLSSNAQNGSYVFLTGQHGALTSNHTGYSISSAAANLAAASQGFGLRGDSISQDSGGPLQFESAFDLTNDQVAAIPTTFSHLATSSGPVTNGRASLVVKAKASSDAPAADDFQEILTIVAASSF